MNISSLLPPVNTTTLKRAKSGVAVAGSEINKDAPKTVVNKERRQRRGQDRRQKNIKPLVDMRSGRDRRKDQQQASISLKV